MSCSSGLYLALSQGIKERIQIYSDIINLNLSTNISGELNVSKLSSSSITMNTINTSNLSSNNMSISNDLTIAGVLTATNMSGSNMSISNNLSVGSNMSVSNNLTVGGVLTAPNINLTGLTSLVIGNALIGNSAHSGYAVFCHKDLNTQTDYALLQGTYNNDTNTYLNSRGTQIRFRHQNADRMSLVQDGAYNMLELFPNGNNSACRIRMRGSGGNYWDCEAPTSEIRWRYNGAVMFDIRPIGDIVANRNIYSNYTATGYTPQYGTNFGMWSHRLWNNDSQRYMALQEQGGDTYLNGYNMLRLRIRNQDRLFVDNNGAFIANGTAISSDDRLKFEEQDISGLSIIRQLKPKKYIKIDLPYVKKRRRYYDEYEVSIIDDYIYDICMNEVDKINQERRDISLNDLSSNDYYRDEDYIHKDKITEEDVNAFVSQEDISKGQVECGLIAQEVLETDISWVVHQQFIPEDIQKPLFQPLSIRYDDIYPYCIQAIKELDVLLQKQNNQYNELDVIVQGLRDKINNLEAENDILLGRVQELENV